MEKTMEWYLVCKLVPDPSYSGTYIRDDFEWLDDRPFPTDVELQQEYEAELARKAVERNNAEALATYNAAVEAGYTVNGVTYDCDESFTNDLVKMVMLTQLRPQEPVYLMDKAGNVHTMTCEDFLQFSADLGYYAYSLRQTYWASLQ